MTDEVLSKNSEFRHQRRMALSCHPIQIGLDYIEVKWKSGDLWDLYIYFVPAGPGLDDKQVVPLVTIDNIRITKGGVDSRDVELHSLDPQKEKNRLELQVGHQLKAGDREEPSNSYRLELVNIPKLDPFFKDLSFGFRKPEQISTKVDPKKPPRGELITREPIEITYLAKDYSSFRQLILDRLSVVMPKWQERNPADMGIILTEILAYAADSASYYQDAVATEAYLSTARQRISIRRHCRLVDYALHEGCNARVWVYLELKSEQPQIIRKDTKLVTGKAINNPVLQPGSREAEEVLKQKGAKIFQTMHDQELRSEHNAMEFYGWGASEYYLEKGATKATLIGHFPHLQPGDVLILEEIKKPQTDEDGDPEHRQAIRLIDVKLEEDLIGGRFKDPPDNTAVPLTEIEWSLPDALKFSLCAIEPICGEAKRPLSVARGNIVLADHGESQPQEYLPSVPAFGDYRPQLSERDLTYHEVYNHPREKKLPAAKILQQDPQKAIPALSLKSDSISSRNGDSWHVRPDLLNSDQFAADFVVEMKGDRTAFLRFGDGHLGKAPSAGTQMSAHYRRGNGAAGNVGRKAIAYILSEDSNSYVKLSGTVTRVYNPLPAHGGIDPEAIADARLNAPQAFRIRENCVTEADYVEVMQRHREVQRAAAQLRWTGSWYTMFIAVDRYEGKPIDATFKKELYEHIKPYRLMGHDLEIVEPTFVPLDGILLVEVKPDYFRSSVRQALRETFGNQDFLNGKRGFFHPDNFSFGQPVFLSRIIQQAMEIPGVYRAEVKRFQVWGRTPREELTRGIITTETLSIVRVDNNPYTPEYGLIEFDIKGGI